MIKTTSPHQLNNPGKQALILDVRSTAEHQTEHLACSHIHIPLDRLNPRDFIAGHNLNQETTVYLVCLGGVRAKKAAEQFIQAGHDNVVVIENGLNGCKSCGIPLKTSANPPMSLERQVRIAAGLVVVLGAAFGLWLNPWFSLVALAAGCGLVFAGVTNSCALGLLLAKAPWNTKGETA